MAYSLTKIAQQMIDQELTLEALRSPSTTHTTRALAGVAISVFYGKWEFGFKAGELTFKQYISKLFLTEPRKVMYQSSVHGLHQDVKKGYRHIAITPPDDFVAFVAKFQGAVPPTIKSIVSKSGLSLTRTVLPRDEIAPNKSVEGFIAMAKELLDEVPSRCSLLARKDRRLHACVLHIIAQHCRHALVDEQCRARFAFNQLVRGLFGRQYAAHHGISLRAVSCELGFHTKTGANLMLHPDPAFVQAIGQHPLTTLMVHNFVGDAADDLRKAKMDPEAMLQHGPSVAEKLAATIKKHSQQQVIDALRIVRGA